MFLERSDLIVHLLELLRLLEAAAAAIGGIFAGKVEVPTPLTRCIAIALCYSQIMQQQMPRDVTLILRRLHSLLSNVAGQ